MEKRSARMKKILFVITITLLGLYFMCYALIYDPWQTHNSRYVDTSSDLGTVEGWEFNTSRDASVYILSDNSTILKPKHFCESHLFLLVIVCSAPNNVLHRNIIRETWGSPKNIPGNIFEIYFLIGDSFNTTLQEDILEENDRYGDIIQDHFIDSYNNLTLKSIAMLKLISMYCTHSITFLMKTDDDMFVNMPPLINMLKASNTSKVLVGSLICGAKPIKDANNKWYAPSYMYNGKVYPNYLSGTGYVMSIDVVPKLYEIALQTPIFHLEDVYITGILSKSIRLRPRNNGGFTFEKRKFDPCVFKTAFTSHRLNPTEILDTYLLLQTTDLYEECRLQQESKNSSLNSIINYFTKAKTKKKKKNLCF